MPSTSLQIPMNKSSHMSLMVISATLVMDGFFFLGFFVVGRLFVFSILDSILPFIFLCMYRSNPKSCIVGASWLSKFLVSCCEKIVCFPILDFKQSKNESFLDCLFFDSIFPSIWLFMHVQEYSNYLL